MLLTKVVDMSFDSHGDLVFVASNGLFIMNDQTRVVNNTNISADIEFITNSDIEFITKFFLINFYQFK
jgi:hypothetical protein